MSANYFRKWYNPVQMDQSNSTPHKADNRVIETGESVRGTGDHGAIRVHLGGFQLCRKGSGLESEPKLHRQMPRISIQQQSEANKPDGGEVTVETWAVYPPRLPLGHGGPEE
ncbi:hypothetical protein EYF80_026867 [Liparis tanakae]|uniref:Uncharacterized protein n=1 Tax=Liparis tanakae TaxID=230148 RepID=A0A4Z2HCB0_9TELE|nr:hypothetical protein EYF80_026867 [Liparis tanakae]